MMTTYSSRKGKVPCGERDLYAFLSDMRNFRTVMPEGIVADWSADEKGCTFRVDKAGTVSVRLGDLLPHAEVNYRAETAITGGVELKVNIERLDDNSSEVILTAALKMNPFMKMIIGDSARIYLDRAVDMIEAYEGYDRIRGCSQPL